MLRYKSLNYLRVSQTFQIPFFLKIMKTIKMIKIMKIIQAKKNEDNHPVNKYMFKVNNRKSFFVSLWLTLSIFTYFTPCSCVFNVDFEHVIVRWVVFSPTNIKYLPFTYIGNLHIFFLSFSKNVCFTLKFILLIWPLCEFDEIFSD